MCCSVLPGTALPDPSLHYFGRMPRILVTGMSGAGKTTLLRELARRGHLTIDTDYDGWILADGTWNEGRMAELLHSASALIVSGTVENQGRFYDRFDAVIVLTVPVDVLLDRVQRRTDNPYGGSAADREEIRGYVVTVEPLLLRGASHEFDGRLPVSDLADAVEQILAGVSLVE